MRMRPTLSGTAVAAHTMCAGGCTRLAGDLLDVPQRDLELGGARIRCVGREPRVEKDLRARCGARHNPNKHYEQSS